jgi:hypothetical protein
MTHNQSPYEATWIKPTRGGAILRLILLVVSSAIVIFAFTCLVSIMLHDPVDA